MVNKSLLSKSLAAITFAFITLLLFISLFVPPRDNVFAQGDLILYGDVLASGFQDWSFAPHALNNTNPVYAGSNSISVSYASNYDGVWFVDDGPGVDTTPYTSIRFAIHGGTSGGQDISVKAGSGTSYPTNAVSLETYLPGGPVASSWRVVTIPLSALNLSAATFNNIAFQSDVAGSQPTFYLDDIRLIAGVAPAPTGITATIHINTNGSSTPIDARVLGSNLPAWLNPTRFADSTFRARTSAAGLSLLRIPGGSWSNGYDWLACENGDGANCYWTWASRPTDFMNFLKATGHEVMYTVNVNDTSKKAAALVAFFNSYITDTTSIGTDIKGTDWYTAGHWAQLRASHGNPQPLGIKLWEIGNEVYGGTPAAGGAQCAVSGWEDVWTCDGTEYVNGVGSGVNRHEGYLEFRAAMRAVDATILVGAVGVPDPATWTNWGNEVIAAAGNNLDLYIVHEYAYFNPPASYAAALAEPQARWDSMIENLNDAFDTYASGRRAPIAVTEYNLFSVQDQDNGQLMTRVVNALFMADTIGQMIENGVVMANQWALANGVAGNGTDFGLLNADSYARLPQYYLYPLWSRFGDQMIPVTSTLSAASELSVYAGRIDADTYSLLAINKTGNRITTTIQLEGAPPVVNGSVDVTKGSSLGAQSMTLNGVSNPTNDLSNAPSLALSSTGNPITYVFEPYSITLLRMNVLAAVLDEFVYLPMILK